MFPSCQWVPQVVPTIYPSSFQHVHIKFLMHSGYVPKLSMCSPSCSHQIPIKFSMYLHQISNAFPICVPSCPWVYQDVPNSTTLHLITFGQSSHNVYRWSTSIIFWEWKLPLRGMSKVSDFLIENWWHNSQWLIANKPINKNKKRERKITLDVPHNQLIESWTEVGQMQGLYPCFLGSV
jgi:hypothetical protein